MIGQMIRADAMTDATSPVPTPRRDPVASDNRSVIDEVREFIAQTGLGAGDKMPSERDMRALLGLGRTDLRRALQQLEDEGRIWRHVGKGTFLFGRMDRQQPIAMLADEVGPADVMRARAALEPAIAREAALHGSSETFARLRTAARRAQRAGSWRDYEVQDDALHRLIAEATGSRTLLELFDQLNALRRLVSRRRVARQEPRPPADHSSFAEHDNILAAITARDGDVAQQAMRMHLRSVEKRLYD